MRTIFIIVALMFGFGTAQANEDVLDEFFQEMEYLRKSCASKSSELKKIKGVTKKVNLWGKWNGKWDGENLDISFSKKSGSFKGKLKKGSKSYGPFNVRICDYGQKFTGVIFGYEAEFVVLSKKKLKVIMPFGNKDEVIVRKVANE